MPKKGYKQNKKHRKNLSKSHIGKAGFWTGKKRSPEDIEKFRKSHLGKKQSEITKKRRSKALKGRRDYICICFFRYFSYPLNSFLQ